MPAPWQAELVEDFGEMLVDVRDRLERPLPIRISQWQVFMAVLLESFAILPMYMIKRNVRLSIDALAWLPHPGDDFREVLDEFQTLETVQPSSMQRQQATEAFHQQLERRRQRYSVELELWGRAAYAANYIGSLIFILLCTSVTLSALTNQHQAVYILAGTIIIAETVAGIICIRGWHRFHQ